MREILFRGKQTDKWNKGEWVEGWYERYPYGRWPLKATIIPADEAEDGYLHHVEVDPETVGQFTGLTDKNGKKIFEGDIVRYMNKETMVISYRNESASFVSTYSAANFNYCASLMSANIYLEVIGNIHDNPKLLENP